MFFDDYPLFTQTSETAASPTRLNLRHTAIIEANRDILRGARVLDLASHDGRWSFAALQAGAAHVTGVEARGELVERAERTFAGYGADPASYRFVHGDMFEVMEHTRFDVDVVLCLGFVYHTLRYPELLHGIKQADPDHCVIDTKVITDDAPTVQLVMNRADVQANATADKWSNGIDVVAGWPSVPALEMMLDAYDMEVESTYDWAGLLSSRPPDVGRAVRDYERGRRVTLRCLHRRDGLARSA